MRPIIRRPFQGIYNFSLRDQFCGIELGDNRFQNLVSNGWQYPLIVIQSQRLVISDDLREFALDIFSEAARHSVDGEPSKSS